MSGWKIIAQIAAFVAVVCAVFFLAVTREDAPRDPKAGMKRLSGTVADGLVYWSPKEPFPRAACDACRVGKVKAGVFSIGGLSTIEFDNLVINIPPRSSEAQSEDAGASAAHSKNDVVDNLGLRPLVGIAHGKSTGRFYGLTVNGFSLGRMVGKELKPTVKAKRIRNVKRKIVVEDMTIFEAEGEKKVAKAELVTKPSLAIVWPQGRIDLSELSAAIRK